MNQFILILFALNNMMNSAPNEFKKRHLENDVKWKIERIGQLPEIIKESSGIDYNKGKIYTHGDSGNDATVYELSYPLKKNEIPKIIQLENAKNKDWEDISIDENGDLWIADTGNNSNKRKKLSLYHHSSRSGNNVNEINFSLEDFPETDVPIVEKSFDLESIFIINDNVYFLSKERGKNESRIYKLLAGDSTIAQITNTLPINRMATGADFNPKSNLLIVSTYSFIYLYELIEGNFIPHSKKKNPFRGQIEAICFVSETEAMFTNENGKVYKMWMK